MNKPLAYAIVIKDIERFREKSKEDVKRASSNFYELASSESEETITLKIKLKMSRDALIKLQQTSHTLDVLALEYVQKEYLESLNRLDFNESLLTKQDPHVQP